MRIWLLLVVLVYSTLAWSERLPEYPQTGPWLSRWAPCSDSGIAEQPSSSLAECLFYFWNKPEPRNRFVSVDSFNFSNPANPAYGTFWLNYDYHHADGRIIKGLTGGSHYYDVYVPTCDIDSYYNASTQSCVPLPPCQCDETHHANGSCQKLPATESFAWQGEQLNYRKTVGTCP